MPWLWRQVENPSSNSVVVEITGSSTRGEVFVLYGFMISHNATSAKKYRFELFNTGTNETRVLFTVVVPANSTVCIDSDEPLTFSIGDFSPDERLKIRAIDGGEPVLSIGIKIRGKWRLETDMYA